MIRRCDLVPQYEAYRDEIHGAIERVLASGRYVLGDEVDAFEHEFARYLGVSHVIGVSDGTRAISLVLRGFGIGSGDEVITTAFTAFPTIGAILETGATPVFADIDPATYLIDIDHIAKRVTARTRAVIPVHIFGNVLDVEDLRSRLSPSVIVIEDAAQAHGSTIHGAKAGSIGDAATFSFYPTKNLGAYGDGGAIATNDDALAAKVRLFRNHGNLDKDRVEIAGVNSRLDEIQAAVLRVKLIHLDEMNEARHRIAARYVSELDPTFITPQRVEHGVVTNWHVYEVQVSRERDLVARHLEANGIQTNAYYEIPQHLQRAVSHLGHRPGSLPHTEHVCAHALALPMYPELSELAIDRIVDTMSSLTLSLDRSAVTRRD